MNEKEVWNVLPSPGVNDVTVTAWQRENPRDEGMSFNDYVKAHFKEVKNETKK